MNIPPDPTIEARASALFYFRGPWWQEADEYGMLPGFGYDQYPS